jgi:very-short-patch-repair endonuclease
MDLSSPVRGSLGVAAGAVTAAELRGPRFRRVYPDTFVAAGVRVDLAVRARAAGVWAAGDGVVAGWAAAELHGASCGPADAPVDLILPGARGRTRAPSGIRPRRVLLDGDEVCLRAGVPVTVPARTAFDVARWAPTPTERVAAAEAVAHVCGLGAEQIRRVWRHHPGAHGTVGLPQVLALLDPRAESPMESRVRMALVLAGLPTPHVQFPVGRYRLDLAYPEVLLGIEYDGAHHRDADQARRDLVREAELGQAGWRVLRYPARVVLGSPESIAAEVRSTLAGIRGGRLLDDLRS